MAEKITYKDHFDADFEAGIDRLKIKIADLYEEFKKLALEQSKTSLVTKETAETNKKLAEANAKLLQMETQLATIRKKNLDAQAKLTVEYQKEVAQRNEAIKSARLLAQVVNAENNSAGKLRATIAFLNSEKEKLNRSTADGIKKYEVWTKTVNNLDAKLTGLGTTMQKQQRNVGNYQYNISGLNMSFNQLTREAPAFANSINTGFMALSNNIPIFVDHINQVREANKAMNAEGIKTPSVFKTMLGAILSWQTAISAGVTLLTVFGGSIIDFFSGADDATKKATESAKKYNDELNQLNTNISNAANKNKDFNISSFFDYKEEDYNKILNKIEEVKNSKGVLLGTKIYDEVAKKYVETGVDEVQAYMGIVGTETEKTIADLDNVLLYYDAELDKIKKEFDKKRKEETKRKQKENNKINAENGLEYLNQQKEFALSEARLLGEHKNILFSIEKEWDLKILNYKRDNNLINETEYKTALNNRLSDINDYIKEVGKLEENLELQTKLRGGVNGTQTISTPIPDMSQYSETRHATLLEYLQIDKNDLNAVKTSYGELYSIVSEEQNRMYELAKKKSDIAKSEVDAARDNLQKQKDLRDEGRAYNLIAAQQELDDAIKFQKKKEAEEFKALKRKQALESVSQATNLISASASIIKDTAGQPYLYVPLIAAMWIAFAGAKARAYKETKQEFANGGTGMIGGGSHASGNDTYFGQRNGKRMYAQNGERWAIFNNRASRNPELERWINDINKGSLSLRNHEQMQVNIFDTKNMERGIEKVAKNTSEKVYYENGKRIVKQGNTTTYYV